MGALWVGVGLSFLVLLRDLPEHGRLAAFSVLLAVWAGDTFAYAGGGRRAPQDGAEASPGKTWEGFVFGTAATLFVAFVTFYKQDFLTIGQSLVVGALVAVAAPVGDLFESMLKRDMDVKDTGPCSAATAACSTASTPSSSPPRPCTSRSCLLVTQSRQVTDCYKQPRVASPFIAGAACAGTATSHSLLQRSGTLSA